MRNETLARAMHAKPKVWLIVQPEKTQRIESETLTIARGVDLFH